MKGGEIGACVDFFSDVRKQADTGRPDDRIRRIAERQYGVISTGQLRSAGLSPAGVSRRVATGALTLFIAVCMQSGTAHSVMKDDGSQPCLRAVRARS
jgi:Transcriptional regulator, AbiEi antitoxin